MPEEEGSPEERPRPRVVDKRVSARPASTPVEDAPTGETPPAPEAAGATRVWTPEQEAEAERVAHEIAATPTTSWIANIGLTLANVAAAKLDRGDLAEAQLAIDGLAALLNGTSGRLEDIETPLRQALAELQMAYAGAVPPSVNDLADR